VTRKTYNIVTQKEYICPECGREFDSKVGVSVHYSKSSGHEGSISGYESECAWCGEDLHIRQKDHLEGNNFCDFECQGKYQRHEMEPEDHGGWKGGNLVTIECDTCGQETEKRKDRLSNHKKFFCSKSCQSEWTSSLFAGENSPVWKEDTTHLDYGSNWHSQRKRARERDEVCQHPDCERIESQNGMKLDVHHIVPFRLWDNKEKANSLDNLITLCRSHHTEIEPKIYDEGISGTTRRRNRSPA